MNKTVTINISGLVFNIDEEAFKTLKVYLESIKRQFKTTEGNEEILSDIEARIAEMFQEKLSNRKEVISQIDVDEVMATMGRPEEFIDADEQRQDSTYDEYDAYSDYSEEGSTSKGAKRFFRDPDNQIIGGVCTGIGHYFGIDPVIVRLIFVLVVFFGGSGVLVYIILWIITPEAKTTAEKLQMKGRKVNIDNIKQTVSEEANNLKKKFGNLEKEADRFRNSNSGSRVGQFFNDLGNFIFNLVRLVLHFIGKFIGLALIVIGGLLLFSLIATLLGFTTFNGVLHLGDHIEAVSVTEMYDFLFNSTPSIRYWIIAGVALTFGIPLLSLFYAGLKILFNFDNNMHRGFGLGILMLWFVGLTTLFVSCLNLGQEFMHGDKIVEEFNLSPTLADTVIVSSNTELLPSGVNPFRNKSQYYVLKNTADELYLSNVTLDVVENNTDSIRIKITRKARGASYKEANKRAKNIDYQYEIIDNRLVFNPYSIINKNDHYRVQTIHITVAIPQGKTIYFDKTSGWIIDDVENVTNTYDARMLNHYWTMTSDGLDCLYEDMTSEGYRERKELERERKRKERKARKERFRKQREERENRSENNDNTTLSSIDQYSDQIPDIYPVFPNPFSTILTLQ